MSLWDTLCEIFVTKLDVWSVHWGEFGLVHPATMLEQMPETMSEDCPSKTKP